MSTPTVTTEEMMLTGFLPIIQSSTGPPTLVNLLCIYIHIIMCKQSQDISYHFLDCFFLVVLQNLWDIYVVDIIQHFYPLPSGDTGPLPNYSNDGTPLGMARAHDTHKIKTKNFQKEANINCALKEHFLSLFTTNTVKSTTPYSSQIQTNIWVQPFNILYDLFGTENKRETQLNLDCTH